MTKTATPAILLVAMLMAGASEAEMFKCTSSAGKVEFRDTPCEGVAGEKIKAKDNSVGSGDDIAAVRRKADELKARQVARRDAEDKANAELYAAREKAFQQERTHQDSVDLANAVREGNAQRNADYYNSQLTRQPQQRVKVEIVNPPSKAPPKTPPSK